VVYSKDRGSECKHVRNVQNKYSAEGLISDALNFVEIDGRHVELLPARTVLSLFSGCGCGGKGGMRGDDGGRGGNGGDGGVGRGGLASTS
jgi:hypothetical protein